MNGYSNEVRGIWRMIACVGLALPLIGAVAGAQAPVFIKDSPGEHLRYFYEQRAYPFGAIPKNALRNARKQMISQFPARGLGFAQAVGNGWTAIGPNNVNINIASSGRLTAIAVHPTTPTTVFAAGAQGGVWKSLNSGASWMPLTDDQCSLAMGSIAIDQKNPDIIYAGTGELHNSFDSYYGCGVLRSIDGGMTWQQLGASVFDVPNPFSGGGVSISKVVIDPRTAGSPTATRVFVTSDNGIFKSEDSGVNWTLLTNGLPSVAGRGGTMSDMVADTTAFGTFYAATGLRSSAPGIYKTIDGGATWTKQVIPPTADIGRIQLAIAQSSPQTLYFSAGRLSDGTLLGIYRTNNGGAVWSQLAASGATCASQCWYDQHIHVDPRNPEIVFFGGFTLHRSIDGGATFPNVSGPIHVDQHSFAFDPVNSGIVYAGNDGGIYRSADSGKANSWTTRNTDIAVHQFYAGFSLHPTNPNRMMGGSQDNGTSEYSGSLSWLHVLGGDGGYTAIDHITGNTAWAETQWIRGAEYIGPRRRDAPSGGGFALKRNGIDINDRAQFIPPLLMDPVNPRVLYFGTFLLYRTRDNGENWFPISGDLTGGSRTITSIAVARSDTMQIYVGTSDGRIQASSNGGASFTSGSGVPNRTVTDIAVDPTNPAVAYATLSGFQAAHVIKTTNRGLSWTSISSNLPDIPANAIVIQPGIEIDIGTDLGVFRSNDDGATWTPFTGLPNVAVFDLVFNPVTRLLVAATHGRGAFMFKVLAVATLCGDATNDNVVSALDAQAVLSATVGLPLPPNWKPTGKNADADNDGAAPRAADAQVILAFVVGLPVPSGACVGRFVQ